jgi:23S rRNA pseudouridine1911/1915/1917 synthase
MDELRRLARAVQELLSSSYSRARHEVEIGHVTVNGEVIIDPGFPLGPDDEIAHRPELPRRARHRNVRPIEILYVDEHVVVVNKPSGLVVHPTVAGERDTVVSRTGAAVEERIGRHKRVLVVHRLDRDTSGVMVMALSHQAAEHLHRQLRGHFMDRRYVALVLGDISREMCVDRSIGRPRPGARRAALAPGSGGKSAITSIHPIERLGVMTVVEAVLGTGRTHQVRVHLSYLGHPVLGDPVYGSYRVGQISSPRLALHAAHLGFVHPTSGEKMAWEAPLPDELVAVISEQRRRQRTRAAHGEGGARETRAPHESGEATRPRRPHTRPRPEAAGRPESQEWPARRQPGRPPRWRSGPPRPDRG